MTRPKPLQVLRRCGAMLTGIVTVLILTAAAAAGPADAVLLASTVPGYVPGMVVGATARLVLPEGASLTLLFRSGEMLRLRGPFDGVLPRIQSESGSGPIAALAAAFRLQGIDATVIGGTRAASLAHGAPRIEDVLIDPQRSGTYCVQPSSSLWIARPGDEAGQYALRRKAMMRRLVWNSGVERTEWHEGLPVEDGDRYEILVQGAARASVTFRTMDELPASTSAWIADGMLRGCGEQFAEPLRRLRQSSAPPELWLTSDHGRRPTYRVGDPIGLTVQSDSDGYLYCVAMRGDGNTVPLFPAGAVDGAQVHGSVPVEIPGHRSEIRLRAATQGNEEVRCWLADRDISPELPYALLAPSLTRLPDQIAVGLDALFGGIEGSRISRATLSIRVE